MNGYELVPLVTLISMTWVAYPCGCVGTCTCYHLSVDWDTQIKGDLPTNNTKIVPKNPRSCDGFIVQTPSCKHPASHHFMLEGLKVHSSIALKGMQNTLSGVEVKPSKFRCIPQKLTLWHHGKIIENANVIEWHNFLTCTINETK